MHLILTGATGLVGSGVLDAMIHSPAVSKISIVSRRPVPMADASKSPKINVVIQRDFSAWDSTVLDQLRGAHGCVWALGISQTKVTSEEYVTITKDYTLAAAKAFSSLNTPSSAAPSDKPSDQDHGSAPFRFVYVSGEGATHTPGRFSQIFARVKGETELALAKLTQEDPSSLRADSVRPAFVDAANHAAIKPYIPDPGLAYKLAIGALGPAIRLGYKSFHSPTTLLGEFLTQMAMGDMDAKLEASGAQKLGQAWVVPNPALRKAMGL